jgi:MHS family proline/betaine transporter-like MFS transporter
MQAGKTRAVIIAGAIGNVLEWYDFAIYGYFATAIGRTFFPKADPVAQVLSAFGIFAVGFLMRPVGGALVGYIGDRLGRRAALTFSVTAMAIPTFLVGLLPGYQVLGALAPLLLTVLRMIQGLSVGGEYTTSIVFMVEHAPPARRGVVGAMGCCGAIAGILLGSATGALLSEILPADSMLAWGWRIPFLLGLLVGLAGFLIRRRLDDGPAPQAAGQSPIREALRNHRGLLLRLAVLSVFNAVGFYILFVYIVSWLQLADGVAPAHALEVNSLSMLVLLPTMVAMGALSDRVGRKPLLLTATALAFLTAAPLFWLLHHEQRFYIQLGQLGFVLSVGMFLGAQPTLMVEEVPAAVRCTAIALGYNVTLGLVGGLSPLVATWLVERTADQLAPAFMIMAAAAVSFLAVLSFRERRGAPLDAVAAPA